MNQAPNAATKKKPRASSGKEFIVVDPQADYGRIRDRWPFAREEIRRHGCDPEVLFVSRDRNAGACAASAARDGADKLLILGDDSTLHEVVNQLMGFPERERPPLGVLAMSAFSQSFFQSILPASRGLLEGERLRASARIAAAGKAVPIDLGLAEYDDGHGEKAQRYFANVASYGISGRILEALPDVASSFHAGLAIAAACARALVDFSAPEITLKSGGKTAFKSAPVLNVFIANGGFSMGGMRVCPDASIRDGKLDALVLPDAPVAEMMLELPKFWLPGPLPESALRFRADSFAASAEDGAGCRLALDGILCGSFPARFSASKNAVRAILS